MKSGVLIWGGRSQARLSILLLEQMGFSKNRIYIFDPTVPYFEIDNVPITKEIENFREIFPNLNYFVVAIGGEFGRVRASIGLNLSKLGLVPLNIVSENATIHPTATIGVGVQILQGAQICPYSILGDYVIVNTNATLDHESNLGIGVHLMGNSTVTGRVTIEDFSTVGSSATILPDLNISSDVYIGAGSVVTKSITASGVYFGVPAIRHSDFKPKSETFDFNVLL